MAIVKKSEFTGKENTIPLSSQRKTSQEVNDAKPLRSPERRKAPATRIIIKYDVGFNNSLFLRGTGMNLSWDKGIPLQNVGPDEWLWETDAPFTSLEFKIVFNDTHYELGENHHLSSGATIEYTPNFNL